MKTKIIVITVLVVFSFQLQAQNLITGSTTRGTELFSVIPKKKFVLTEKLGFKFDKIEAGPVTLSGKDNSITFNMIGIKTEMGFDGLGSVEADLKFISASLISGSDYNYVMVKTSVGNFDFYFKIGKPAENNAMTSAMTLHYIPEMPYSLGIIDTSTGDKYSLDGKTKEVYRTSNMNDTEENYSKQSDNDLKYSNLLFSENFQSSELNTSIWEITKNKGNVTYAIENNTLKLNAHGSGDHWITIESKQAFEYPIILEYSIAVPGNRNWLRSGFTEGGPNISSGNENHDSRFAYFNGVKNTFKNAVDADYHNIIIIWYSENEAEFRDITAGNKVILKSINLLNPKPKKLYFSAGDIYSKNNQIWIKNIKVYELK